MKTRVLAAAVAGAFATAAALPAFAGLDKGEVAPDFTAPAFLAGKPFTFNLGDALKKGPVVLYFFPAAHTPGCNIEAHQFADAADQFKAAGATLIGITAGKTAELQAFSEESEHCSGKFPVASDATGAITKSYRSTLAQRPDLSDRTSYVIGRDHKVVLAYTNMQPSGHVEQTLAAVQEIKTK